jgi:hypothetical protein
VIGHQPLEPKLRQGGFHGSGMWPFLRQKFSRPLPALVTKEDSMTAITPDHHHGSLITRRSIFIGAAVSLICAPAIVRTASLMPVRSLILPIVPIVPMWAGFVERLRYDFLEKALRAGWDDRRHGPIVGGISESQARRSVAYARAQGWLSPEAAFKDHVASDIRRMSVMHLSPRFEQALHYAVC